MFVFFGDGVRRIYKSQSKITNMVRKTRVFVGHFIMLCTWLLSDGLYMWILIGDGMSTETELTL